MVKLSTVKALQPGQAAKIMAKCVKGSVPVSDAEQSGDAPKSVGGIGGVQVTSVSLGKRDVTVEAFNPTATEQQLQVGASCVPKDLKLHKAVQIDRHSFDLASQGERKRGQRSLSRSRAAVRGVFGTAQR